MALDQSRLWRFATCSYKPVAGGLLPSLTLLAAAHRHYDTKMSPLILTFPESHIGELLFFVEKQIFYRNFISAKYWTKPLRGSVA
jgi:hypothetical protein